MDPRLLFAARLLAGLLAVAGATVQAAKPHAHGAVKLDVAVEGVQVSLAVEMPLDSVVGFERAPRTDAERKLAAAALARLQDGATLFRLDPAARCTLTDARIDAPLLAPQSAAAAAATPSEGHADLTAHYVFRCGAPAQLHTLTVLVFDAFGRVERVHVQAALPHGQRKTVLRRDARVLRLAP